MLTAAYLPALLLLISLIDWLTDPLIAGFSSTLIVTTWVLTSPCLSKRFFRLTKQSLRRLL